MTGTAGSIQRAQPNPNNEVDSDGFVIKIAPAGPLQIRIASSGNPSIAGNPITLTVSVNGGLDGLKGRWSWCDGDICTPMPSVSTGTVINVPFISLATGSHNLTARYEGDGVNPPTVSPVFVQVVNDPEPNAGAQASTTSLQSSAGTVSAGQTVTLTVTVSTAASFFCGQGLTAGQIELFDSGIPAGTIKTNPSNSTTISPSFTLKWPSPGTHYLTARYSGSPCATSSASNPVAVTVDDFAPQVVISTPANGARFQSGSTITLGAIAASPGGRTIASVKFAASSVGGSGVFVGTTATAAPYTTTWSKSLTGATGGVPTGTYQIVADATDSSGVTVRSAPITIEVAPSTAIGESITYLHNDVTGNTVMATNEAGAVLWKESYRPYGERLRNESASAANRQFFHGKAYDSESGLQYFGARYFDPVLGRFMGVDPVGFKESNLHSFNRYAYGNNNPYRYTDPDGRFPVLLVPLIYAAIGAMAAGGTNASIQYMNTGSVEWNGIGGVLDAAGDGAILGPLGAMAGVESATVTGARGATVSAAKGVKPDFVVSRDGAIVHSSPDKVRASLEGAGFPAKSVQNDAGTEGGTIHNIPGMKMDARVMDGGPNHPARVVTSRQGTSQPVNPANGSNFGNVPKVEQRERSHIVFP